MTTAPLRSADRLLDLLADRAVAPLSRIEEAELDAMLRCHPDIDTDAMDLAAAAADLALFASAAEPMPESLRAKVSAIGTEWSDAKSRIATSPSLVGRSGRGQGRRSTYAAWTGWIAAAAAVALAFAGWWTRATPVRAPEDGLRILRASATDVQVLEWATGPTDTCPAASGEVIWSPSRQEGYMVFRNMRANNPDTEQYQLWIFDKQRDERYPVDGGIFDIATPGECIVPIRPAVHVNDATLFAVTIERPGGVVVSDRARLPLLAQRKPAG